MRSCLVLVAACAATSVSATLRGSRQELSSFLSDNPRFSRVSTALASKSPASKVLELLDGVISGIEKAKSDDNAAFEKMKGKCAHEAGIFRAHANKFKSAKDAASHTVSAASRAIEQAHMDVIAATQQEANEEQAAKAVEQLIASADAAFSDDHKAHVTASNAYDEVVHAIEALIAHMEASAPTLEKGKSVEHAVTTYSLLELASKAERAGMATHAKALRAHAGEGEDEEEDKVEYDIPVVSSGREEVAPAEPAPAATGGASSDVTLEIVDLILSMRRSVHDQQRNHRSLHERSKEQFENERKSLIARRDSHIKAQQAARKARDDANARREAAEKRRSEGHKAVQAAEKELAKSEVDAQKAEAVCVDYAKQFQQRRKNHEKDLEAATVVRSLIEEKQRVIKEKLSQLGALYGDVTGLDGTSKADSMEEFAAENNIPPVKPEVEAPVRNEVEELKKAVCDQAEKIAEEAAAEEMSATGLAAPAATGFAGVAFGGDF